MARRDNYSVALLLLIGALYVQSANAVKMTQQNTINPSDYLFYNMKSAEILTAMEGTTPNCPNFFDTLGINITDTNNCNTEWYLNYCNIYSPTSDSAVAANDVNWNDASSTQYFNDAWVCKGANKWGLYYPTNCSWVTGEYTTETGHCGANPTPVLAAPSVPTITQPHNFAPTLQAGNQVSISNFDDSAAWEHRVELQNRLSNAVNQATQGLPAGWNVVDIVTTTSDSASLNNYFGQFTLDAEAPAQPTPHHCSAPAQPVEPVETVETVEYVETIETVIENGHVETIVIDVPVTYETIETETSIITPPYVPYIPGVPAPVEENVEYHVEYVTIVENGETETEPVWVCNLPAPEYIEAPTVTYETVETETTIITPPYVPYIPGVPAPIEENVEYHVEYITVVENGETETEPVWVCELPAPEYIEAPIILPAPVEFENVEYTVTYETETGFIPGVPAPYWTYETTVETETHQPWIFVPGVPTPIRNHETVVEEEVVIVPEQETHETVIVTEVIVTETVYQIINGELVSTSEAGEETNTVVSIGENGNTEVVFYNNVESEGESHGEAPLVITTTEYTVENGEATTTEVETTTTPDGEVIIITNNVNNNIGKHPNTWTPIFVPTELETEIYTTYTEVETPVIIGGWVPDYHWEVTENGVENVEYSVEYPIQYEPGYYVNYETNTETEYLIPVAPVQVPIVYNDEDNGSEYWIPRYPEPLPPVYTETETHYWIPGVPAPVWTYETYTETQVEEPTPVWIPGVPAPAWTYETTETVVETETPAIVINGNVNNNIGKSHNTWTPVWIPVETEQEVYVENVINTHYGWYVGSEENTPVAPQNNVVVIPSWNTPVETEEVVYSFTEVEVSEEEFVQPVVEPEEPTSYTYVSQSTGNEVVVRFVCPGDAQEADKTFLAIN